MGLIASIRIKLRSLYRYYVFQRLGFPRIEKEQISKSFIKKFLPKSPVIIDCGAHDGSDSVELAKILKGRVHSFEPVEVIFKRLKQKTSGNSNILCYPYALSDSTGTQHFYVSEGQSDASSSLLKPKEHLADHPDTFFKEIIEVKTFTLDDWAEQERVDYVDLLWLDMQGFELQMLKESNKILPTVKVIHTEISTKETYSGAGMYQEYKAFLEDKGFKLLLEAIPRGWDMGNVVFIRE